MRSPKRVSLLLRISRVGFPQTTTCVVVAPPGGLEIFANVVCRSGILGVDSLLVVSQTLNHGLE